MEGGQKKKRQEREHKNKLTYICVYIYTQTPVHSQHQPKNHPFVIKGLPERKESQNHNSCSAWISSISWHESIFQEVQYWIWRCAMINIFCPVQCVCYSL